jgi:signal transduction histidine kinase
MPCPVEIPAGMCSDHQVEPLLRNLRDYIGLHTPVRNEYGDVVDLQLLWWNDAYEGIRIHPPVVGQSMMATYYEPEGVLEIVAQVLEQGTVKQIFSIGEKAVDHYHPPELLVRIEVTWMLVGDAIVEIGSDLSQMTALELDLIAQRKAYTDATRQATLESERSRIARDLHDSIIQNLFAISLNLKTREDKDWAINSLNDVISEIRSTIFDITPDSRPPLTECIERVVDMFSSAWPSPPTLHVHLQRELPDDLVEDVENVLREALSNAARHAKATNVEASVLVTTDTISVTVTDDGIGPQGSKRRKGGTLSLAHRATTHGGSFALQPGPNGGSVMTWVCPIN